MVADYLSRFVLSLIYQEFIEGRGVSCVFELRLLGLHIINDDELYLDVPKLEKKRSFAGIGRGVEDGVLHALLDIGENFHEIIFRSDLDSLGLIDFEVDRSLVSV